ncbi:hypothetical protein [Pectobacterium sp. CFBP8739]|uniref:hypothetical protein n=1 Tax=unclassified Pectobacterium TaxID=2627739 RepID=UPI0015DF9F20|nr:hypothetical protein [Pectobacterium sp. CFBP8739]MBA0169560.1 hypothetical protein [Pectobacterium sp. CFBP8739]
MKNDFYVRSVQSLLILVVTILSMIALSVFGKLFFSSLSWLLGDEFNTSWKDILHMVKIGLYGGGIGGLGLALLHLFKVKGF